MKWRNLVAAATAAMLAGGSALAATGQPKPWEMTLQEPATPIMERIASFHTLLLVIITLITLLVFALIGYVVWRFRESRNPVPSRRSHHTVLEVVWTAVPVLILVIIAIPSFKLLYFIEEVPEAEMRVKAVGHQWYWSYVYPDHGNFTFDAIVKADDELESGEPRLLATDNYIVLPVGTRIRLQVTADDVLHSWAVPAFGIKVDAIPGRLNDAWLEIEEPGVYYGQCSELCGVNHGFMPIAIRAVPKDEFEVWVEQAQKEFARLEQAPVAVASADR